jgi:methionyl-tRNA formyltransferase
MKIVFFGTSNVALPVLTALANHHEIAGVVTMPDSFVGRKKILQESPVSVLAKELQVANIFKPKIIKGNEEFLQQLKNIQAEIFVVVSYGKILPLEIINLPTHKTVNVHFSLLPKYRGASPIQFALLNGESVTGTSIFILDEKMDEGPILAQKDFAIDSDDNFLTLSQKLAFESAKLLLEVLSNYQNGSVKAVPQDHSLATYTKIISREDGKIDWTKSASQIYNQFRAFYPWPGIWTLWNGKKVKITDCLPTELSTFGKALVDKQIQGTTDNYRCGQILDGGIVVCGAETFLQIKSLQVEGKNETKIEDFLNGNKGFVGGIF